MLKYLVLIALLSLSACAAAPERIAPSAPAVVDCTDRAQLEFTQELYTLSEQQRKIAQTDAVYVALLGYPKSRMGGADYTARIAELKGRITACS